MILPYCSSFPLAMIFINKTSVFLLICVYMLSTEFSHKIMFRTFLPSWTVYLYMYIYVICCLLSAVGYNASNFLCSLKFLKMKINRCVYLLNKLVSLNWSLNLVHLYKPGSWAEYFFCLNMNLDNSPGTHTQHQLHPWRSWMYADHGKDKVQVPHPVVSLST